MRVRNVAGRSVAAIGLGDVSFARATLRNHDVGDVVRCVHDALEASIDVIDVAPEPDAERAVGDAVRTLRLRDRAVVITRVAALAERPESFGAPTRDVLPERLPIGYVQERVEASLRATRLDALPLVQLPLAAAWLTSSAWPELRGACERLVSEGKVMAWAAWCRGADDDRELVQPWLAAFSVDYSLCERGADAFIDALAAPVIRPATSDHAPVVFARRPLAGGALAGVLGPGAILSRTDDRRDADLDAIAIGVAKLAHLVKVPPPAARATPAARAIAETATRPDVVECETLAELALRFAIDRGALPLPRLHRREDLAVAIAAAASGPLSPGLLNIDSVSSRE